MDIFKDIPLKKWIWIELTGFDNQSADYGVASYLNRCEFIPEGFSLLLYWSGFVFNHDGMETEKKLSVAEASYGGHPACPERQRQDWTNWQLRGLINTIQQHNIKVYLSFFNMYAYTDDKHNMVCCDYFKDKLYLMETNKNGQTGAISMLKRLKDGSYYEDVFQEKTMNVLTDYGFDGIQIADGISSPRISLQEGDYTDDMVFQFLDDTQVVLPDIFYNKCDDNVENMSKRANWIWEYHRKDWIYFHTRRWERFYQKFVKRITSIGKKAIFNSAWTRDTFEAIYRYGVDYRKVTNIGLSACMVEDVSPTLAILSSQDNGYLMNDEQRKRVHFEFLTTLMINRASMHNIHIQTLSSIHDTMEQWGSLEHSPTGLMRNVISNLNTYFVTDEGLKPILDGPFFCLGDSLSKNDWDFIKRIWEIGYTKTPISTSGITLIWNDNSVDVELENFINSRKTPTRKFVSELLYHGAPISAIARIEDLKNVSGGILVVNPECYSSKDYEKICAYKNGIIFSIGSTSAIKPPFSAICTENNSFENVSLSMIAAAGMTIQVHNSAQYNFNSCTSQEPIGGLWTHSLTYMPISDTFFNTCASHIIIKTYAPMITTDNIGSNEPLRAACKYICVNTSKNTAKVILTNDDYYYNIPSIRMERKIKTVTCLTKYSGYVVERHGNSFSARVPERGVEVFNVVFEDSL